VVLIAANEAGYANLVRLVSRAYLDTPSGEPVHVTADMLAALAEGIICLTGGPRGPLGSALKEDRRDLAEERLLKLKAMFGDRLYVELERMSGYDRAVEQAMVELAYRHELPLVATNEAFFRKREDYEAHDALIAIAESSVIASDDRRRLSSDNHLKSQAEMAALFSDLPEALDNTVEIARRCSYYPKNRKPILPRFAGADVADPEAAEKAEAEELKLQAREGLARRLEEHGPTPGHTVEEYGERLEFELGIIEKMKFPGYFLIVSDFIKWARPRHSRGAGRGSGPARWSPMRSPYRRRPAALLAAVRALPQPRPRLDARLRHRLLPGPARGGDPLREGQVRPRPGGADHHLRNAPGARCAARCRPRAQMPYGQVVRLCKLVPQNPANRSSWPTPSPTSRASPRRSRRSHRPDPARHGAKLEGLTATPPRMPPASSSRTGRCRSWCRMYRDPRSDCRSRSST